MFRSSFSGAASTRDQTKFRALIDCQPRLEGAKNVDTTRELELAEYLLGLVLR
jgi:hypothetical protein